MATVLDHKELSRYNRQLRIPDIGEEGQKKLKGSHVVIAGIGGAGVCFSNIPYCRRCGTRYSC